MVVEEKNEQTEEALMLSFQKNSDAFLAACNVLTEAHARLVLIGNIHVLHGVYAWHTCPRAYKALLIELPDTSTPMAGRPVRPDDVFILPTPLSLVAHSYRTVAQVQNISMEFARRLFGTWFRSRDLTLELLKITTHEMEQVARQHGILTHVDIEEVRAVHNGYSLCECAHK